MSSSSMTIGIHTSPMSISSSQSEPAQDPSFSGLPIELRVRIYSYVQRARTVTVYYEPRRNVFLTTTPNPVLLAVSAETRLETLRSYRKAFSQALNDGNARIECLGIAQQTTKQPPAIYVNFERDIIYLEPLPSSTILKSTVDTVNPSFHQPMTENGRRVARTNLRNSIHANLNAMPMPDKLSIRLLALDDFHQNDNANPLRRVDLSSLQALERVSMTIQSYDRNICEADKCVHHLKPKEMDHVFLDGISLKGVWQGWHREWLTTTDHQSLPIIAADRVWRAIGPDFSHEEEEQQEQKGKEGEIVQKKKAIKFHEVTHHQVQFMRGIVAMKGRFWVSKISKN